MEYFMLGRKISAGMTMCYIADLLAIHTFVSGKLICVIIQKISG